MQRDIWMVVMCLGLLLMIVFKHRDNLQRLFAGTERRIDQKVQTTSGDVTEDTNGNPPTPPT
jgi:hypothetical protein